MGKTIGREDVRFDGRVVGAIYLRGLTWWFDYRPNPLPQSRKKLTLKTEDRRTAARLAEEHAANHSSDAETNVAVIQPVKRGLTLAAALTDYETDRVALGFWRESSRQRNMFTLEEFVRDMGEDKHVGILTEERIDAWIKARMAKGNNSPATCASDFSRVRAWVYWLAKKKYLSRKPDLTEMGPSPAKARKSAGKRSLSPIEVENVAAHLAERSDAYWSEWFAVGIGCGLRPGEQSHLRGQDYDAEKKVLHVREYDGFETKTENAPRSLPIGRTSPEAAEILARRKLAAGADGLLFPALGRGGHKPEVGHPWRRESLHHALTAACAGSGVRVMPYGLRHAFARRAVAAGWALPFLRDWMGHKSASTTENYFKEIGLAEFAAPPVLAPVKAAVNQ